MATERQLHRWFHLTTSAVYFLVSAALLVISLAMIGHAIWEVAHAFIFARSVVDTMLEAIGQIVISVAVFDVAKYLMEEEVLRERELRSAREARQTLTKFLVIIAIAVTLEALVFIFGAGSKDVNGLLYPTLLLAVSVLLIVGLGLYQRLSMYTERQSAQHDDNG